ELQPSTQIGTFPPTRLTVLTRPERHATLKPELCDDARISTFVYKDGRIYHRIEFRLWHWHDRVCEVKLPADFHVVAVKVQNQWLDRLDLNRSTVAALTLPVDQNTDFTRFEIHARSGSDAFSVPGLTRVAVSRVGWPIAPVDVRTRIFLQEGMAPV